MIGGVTGLVVTLVALVLGLLIWTAFGVFSTQKAELQGIAANALEFNQETREYGPEAAHARALMRADLDYAHRQLWGDDQTKAAAIAASIRNMDSLSVVLDHLEPTTDAQKSLLADAKHNYEAIWQSRILMSLQGVDAVSWPVLYVVSAWTCIAFFLTGLNSKSSRATIAVAALGSFCVASAMFLILELSQPYTSSMRVASDGIDRVGRTRQALKEHRVGFRAGARAVEFDVKEVNGLRGAEIRCIKLRSPAQRSRPERLPRRSASRRVPAIPEHLLGGQESALCLGRPREDGRAAAARGGSFRRSFRSCDLLTQVKGWRRFFSSPRLGRDFPSDLAAAKPDERRRSPGARGLKPADPETKTSRSIRRAARIRPLEKSPNRFRALGQADGRQPFMPHEYLTTPVSSALSLRFAHA